MIEPLGLVDGHWLAVKRTDERAFELYSRHYSFEKNAPYRKADSTNVTGSGETMVLLSQCGRALFVWLRNVVRRLDGQEGVNCAVFRNEGAGLSSELIREADDLAWQRWPGLRHFTYVDATRVRRKRDPGRCFIKAGWQPCGYSANGKLLLERFA